MTQWKAGEVAYINETLARQLAARKGDSIILRVRKPSALGLDAAISPRNEDTVALRLKIGAILSPELLGDLAKGLPVSRITSIARLTRRKF